MHIELTLKTVLIFVGLLFLGLAAFGATWKWLNFGWAGLFLLGLAAFVF